MSAKNPLTLKTAIVPSLISVSSFFIYQWLSSRSKPRAEVCDTTKKCRRMSAQNPLEAAIVPSLICLSGYLLYQWLSNRSKPRTEVADTTKKCNAAVKIIRKHCREKPVLGFDCEWGYEDNVPLLQLCTYKGYCVLIRLCCLKEIPTSLHELLSDPDVIKIGVGAIEDAKRLTKRAIYTESTLDLRFVAVLSGAKPQRLSAMYEAVVGKSMKEGLMPWLSDWNADKLTQEQIKYAAEYAVAAIEIYKKLTKSGVNVKTFQNWYDTTYFPYYYDGLRPVKYNKCSIL